MPLYCKICGSEIWNDDDDPFADPACMECMKYMNDGMNENKTQNKTQNNMCIKCGNELQEECIITGTKLCIPCLNQEGLNIVKAYTSYIEITKNGINENKTQNNTCIKCGNGLQERCIKAGSILCIPCLNQQGLDIIEAYESSNQFKKSNSDH